MHDRVDARSPTILVSTTLPAEPASARVARRLIQDRMGRQFHPDVIDTILLLTTELLSNAAACATTPLILCITGEDRQVLVEVADSARTAPRPATELDLSAERGRGLTLVRALSYEWGFTPATVGGKVVWFTVQT